MFREFTNPTLSPRSGAIEKSDLKRSRFRQFEAQLR